ncbi:MAG: polysaccharide export protein [Leptolyngbyaceae cyanobacterium SM1_1_3]|nr:polysaccharide export protein [Leptolyngbyaceae cyanobacterium SM1_1_3]NJN03015.1 polysaccharide export protein [Leptolyngbyaceae cyanobacterium RM1_1_2]NJO08369.1 polysaccharide export protein [Leptolyngbyaceae cyanobacterium SL_1_1]
MAGWAQAPAADTDTLPDFDWETNQVPPSSTPLPLLPPRRDFDSNFPDVDRPVFTPELRDRGLDIPEQPDFDVYRLGPGDAIFASVQRFRDLNFQATLDLEGNVIVPIVGAVSLEGLTLQQAEDKISSLYDQYVVDPTVSLTLVAQRPVEVTVLGEVVRPGFYPLPAPTVSTALLASGGSTNVADLRAVQIQRQLPEGQTIEETVDLFTPLSQGEALPDLRLDDGDVVFVPRLDLSELDEYDRYLVSRSTLAQQQVTIRTLGYSASGGTLRTLQLPNGSRFIDAITEIGVNADRNSLRNVALIRFDPELGQAVTLRLDTYEALDGDLSQNPPLENNDVIIVNRNLVARITYAFNTFTQPFRDVLGFLLFFDSLSDSAGNLFGPGNN